nr:translation initiation factor IF-2-like [Aegilops tauschii subsp. strangulata]
MAPKNARAAPSSSWYEPTLDALSISDKNLAIVLLMMAEGDEKRKTELRAGSAELEASGGTFYRFFMSSIVAGLVPPFSDFFYSVLCHYKIHTLHLRAHRPLWKLGDEGDDLCLRPVALSDEELRSALRSLVGNDQGYPPDSFVPLFRHSNGAEAAAVMPVFDGRGLVPPAPSNVLVTMTQVDVSSDESRKEEEEERDSKATRKGAGETSPLRKADILRTLPDDDDKADVPLERGEPPVAGESMRSKVSPRRRSPAKVPTRGRSGLISRDGAPALTLPGAASGPSPAPSSAPGVRAPAPQAVRLSGFKLRKRRDYAAVDQSTPATKKRKEETVVLLGTKSPAAVAPPSVGKGGDGARASPARLSSQGLGERPLEEAAPVAPLAPEVPMSGPVAVVPKAQELPASRAMVTMLPPPPPAALLTPDPSASPDILEHALSALTLLREDLQGTDRRLVAGCLELISGWLHSDVSVRAALSQPAAASEKDKQAVAQAAAAREVALKDAGAAQDRCRSLEAELETMRNEHADEARGHKAEEEKMKAREDAVRGRDAELEQLAKAQAAERTQLEKLERKMKAEKAELEAKAKVLAEDRVAFKSLEERSRVALRALYEKGLEEPLATDDEGPTQLLPHLVVVLEDVVGGISPLEKGEARTLSSAALARVFSHLHRCDPDANLDELLEPVDDERCTAAAKAVKGQPLRQLSSPRAHRKSVADRALIVPWLLPPLVPELCSSLCTAVALLHLSVTFPELMRVHTRPRRRPRVRGDTSATHPRPSFPQHRPPLTPTSLPNQSAEPEDLSPLPIAAMATVGLCSNPSSPELLPSFYHHQ